MGESFFSFFVFVCSELSHRKHAMNWGKGGLHLKRTHSDENVLAMMLEVMHMIWEREVAEETCLCL